MLTLSACNSWRDYAMRVEWISQNFQHFVACLFTLCCYPLLSCREASNSILHFFSDIFDLANTTTGEPFLPIRDSIIIPRGSSITRILVASLTGALPKSRVEVVIFSSHCWLHFIFIYIKFFLIGWSLTFSMSIHLHVSQVSYTLLALTRSYGMLALEWARKSITLIPSTAVTDLERSRFLKALSDVASGGDTNGLSVPIEELSDVCRRNRAVQEIVQDALRPLELNLVCIS